MTTKYSFKTKIVTVKEQFEFFNWRVEVKDGNKLNVCDRRSIGYFVTLEGSRESMYVGDTRPDLVEGQNVTVSIVPHDDKRDLPR